MSIFLQLLLAFTSMFLILIILVQRGRGGGLAGAFGGMGGQSAFGTKAGDTFTRITIGVAFFWILLCVGSARYFNSISDMLGAIEGPANAAADETPGAATNEGDKEGTDEGETAAPSTDDSAAETEAAPADDAPASDDGTSEETP